MAVSEAGIAAASAGKLLGATVPHVLQEGEILSTRWTEMSGARHGRLFKLATVCPRL